METRQRIVLLLIVVVVTVCGAIKGHGTSHRGNAVAFLPGARSVTGTTVIKIQGDVQCAGIYGYNRKTDVETVINMTVQQYGASRQNILRVLQGVPSGTIVAFTATASKHVDITKLSMSSRERMVLGIPLDENSMDQRDWEALPGIGKKTAERIVAYRQINGAFTSLSELESIPGIGPATVKKIRQFFLSDN